MIDLVNKPPHYNKGGVEAIDYIKQQLGKDFPAYLEGSAIKYIHRHKFYHVSPNSYIIFCQDFT